MRSIFMKTALASSILLAAAGYTEIAQAHCLNGGKLAAATNNLDLYRVQCFTAAALGDGGAVTLNPTQRLVSFVNNQSGGNGVQVQVAREGFTPSPVRSDTASGGTLDTDNLGGTCLPIGGAVPSAEASLAPPDTVTQPGTTATNGNGDYNIVVNKVGTASAIAAGSSFITAKTYGLTYHCLDTLTSSDASLHHTGTREIHGGSANPELVGNQTNIATGYYVSPNIDLLIDQ